MLTKSVTAFCHKDVSLNEILYARWITKMVNLNSFLRDYEFHAKQIWSDSQYRKLKLTITIEEVK